MDWSQGVLLLLAMAALAALPSMSVGLVVARAAASGFGSGAAVTLGIVLGDLMFAGLALVGMTTLAKAFGGVFLLVRLAAGGYLLWLGLALLLGGVQRGRIAALHTAAMSPWRDVLAGLLLTLSDMKAVFFYASLFPAFVDLTRVGIADIGLILLTTTVGVGGVKLAYAAGAGRLAGRWRRASGRRVGGALAGAGMIGAGSYLLLKP